VRLDALETTAKATFGEGAVSRSAGSTSITPFAKVLVKLVPQSPGPNEFIMLGVSTSLGHDTWSGEQFDGPLGFGSGKNIQPFYFLELPSG